MEEPGVTVLDVLAVWPCARAIFKHVPARNLVRSERVSRRWQHAVYDYLQASRHFLLYSSIYRIPYFDELEDIIEIKNNKSPWSTLSKTVKKLGPFIKSLTTNCADAEHLRIIEMNCPRLQSIRFYGIETNSDILNKLGSVFIESGLENFKELKQISILRSENMPDLLFNEPLQTIGFEKIVISECQTTGSFLKHVKLDNLKSLCVSLCGKFNLRELKSITHELRNLTALELDFNGVRVLQNVPKLLTKLPKLENLSLYRYRPLRSKEKLLESLSQLYNLRSLCLQLNQNVDCELIEVVMQNCKKLQYLNISDTAQACCVRCLSAMCLRPPPAVTTLCWGWINNFTAGELAELVNRFPTIGKLQALGCIEVTPQWLEATARASQGSDDIEIQLRQTCTPNKTGQPLQELKIKLHSTHLGY